MEEKKVIIDLINQVQALSGEVSELKKSVAVLSAKVKRLDGDFDQLEYSRGEEKAIEAPTIPGDDEHLFIVDDAGEIKKPKTADRIAFWVEAENAPPGMTETMLTVCDELYCIKPEHHMVAEKRGVGKFNRERVERMLMAQDRHEVGFDALQLIESVPGDHWLAKDSSHFPLPGGRKVSLLKALLYSLKGVVFPADYVRGCKFDECINPDHQVIKT